MSADGVWNITVNSPLGPQASSLTLKAEGAVLTGSQSAMGDTRPISSGKIDGNTVSWSNSVTSPFPMNLEFTGKVEGDSLNGSVKAGGFGSFPFTGKRG
jgi:hypothetical protein